MTDFVVKTGQFEGPLDLLLDLIEKQKMHISDVSLAKVTDDYVNYVKNLGEISIDKTAHFILIASTLLLIKSKALLPSLVLSEEEQADIKNLEYRLKIYQKIKLLSKNIENTFGKNMIFQKSRLPEIEPIFSPETSITQNSLLESIKSILKNLPSPNLLPKAIVNKVITLEETITNLLSRIQSNLRLSFKEFSKLTGEEKQHVIVSFLAMLELVKQGVINVTQKINFDDIEMESASIITPRY